MHYTRAQAKYYSSLDPRDPDYLDIEEEDEDEDEDKPEEEWVDNPEDDYVMTEPELRGEL